MEIADEGIGVKTSVLTGGLEFDNEQLKILFITCLTTLYMKISFADLKPYDDFVYRDC